MTNDDEKGEGGKNAKNLMTSYVNDPFSDIIMHNYHGHYLHPGGLSVNNYVREKKSVKLMSVNNKVRDNIGPFQCGFFLVSVILDWSIIISK